MTLQILGGSLTPVLHDGTPQDSVYGADAHGQYLGVVPNAQAVQIPTGPPPALGDWRWDGAAWQPYKPVAQRALEIEQQRDLTIGAGVTWNGRVWYADAAFQQQLAAYLQAFSEGILSPTATVGIRSKDKMVYDIGRDDLRLLAATVLAFVQQAFAASWAAKAAISG